MEIEHGSASAPYQRHDNHRKQRPYVPYRRPARAKQDLEDAWWTGSPQEEAKSFLAFMLRTGSTPALIEEMILVTDAEFLELNQWVNQRPVVLPLIERMMEFREETLKHFRALVEEMPPAHKHRHCRAQNKNQARSASSHRHRAPEDAARPVRFPRGQSCS